MRNVQSGLPRLILNTDSFLFLHQMLFFEPNCAIALFHAFSLQKRSSTTNYETLTKVIHKEIASYFSRLSLPEINRAFIYPYGTRGQFSQRLFLIFHNIIFSPLISWDILLHTLKKSAQYELEKQVLSLTTNYETLTKVVHTKIATYFLRPSLPEINALIYPYLTRGQFSQSLFLIFPNILFSPLISWGIKTSILLHTLKESAQYELLEKEVLSYITKFIFEKDAIATTDRTFSEFPEREDMHFPYQALMNFLSDSSQEVLFQHFLKKVDQPEMCNNTIYDTELDFLLFFLEHSRSTVHLEVILNKLRNGYHFSNSIRTGCNQLFSGAETKFHYVKRITLNLSQLSGDFITNLQERILHYLREDNYFFHVGLMLLVELRPRCPDFTDVVFTSDINLDNIFRWITQQSESNECDKITLKKVIVALSPYLIFEEERISEEKECITMNRVNQCINLLMNLHFQDPIERIDYLCEFILHSPHADHAYNHLTNHFYNDTRLKGCDMSVLYPVIDNYYLKMRIRESYCQSQNLRDLPEECNNFSSIEARISDCKKRNDSKAIIDFFESKMNFDPSTEDLYSKNHYQILKFILSSAYNASDDKSLIIKKFINYFFCWMRNEHKDDHLDRAPKKLAHDFSKLFYNASEEELILARAISHEISSNFFNVIQDNILQNNEIFPRFRETILFVIAFGEKEDAYKIYESLLKMYDTSNKLTKNPDCYLVFCQLGAYIGRFEPIARHTLFEAFSAGSNATFPPYFYAPAIVLSHNTITGSLKNNPACVLMKTLMINLFKPIILPKFISTEVTNALSEFNHALRNYFFTRSNPEELKNTLNTLVITLSEQPVHKSGSDRTAFFPKLTTKEATEETSYQTLIDQLIKPEARDARALLHPLISTYDLEVSSINLFKKDFISFCNLLLEKKMQNFIGCRQFGM